MGKWGTHQTLEAEQHQLMERNGVSAMHNIPLATLTFGPELSEGLLIASVCVYCASHVG